MFLFVVIFPPFSNITLFSLFVGSMGCFFFLSSIFDFRGLYLPLFCFCCCLLSFSSATPCRHFLSVLFCLFFCLSIFAPPPLASLFIFVSFLPFFPGPSFPFLLFSFSGALAVLRFLRSTSHDFYLPCLSSLSSLPPSRPRRFGRPTLHASITFRLEQLLRRSDKKKAAGREKNGHARF